jgi:hypothetical protein
MTSTNLKLQYNIHGELKGINLPIDEKIAMMNYLIATTYKVDIDNYEIFYGKNFIKDFEKPIKDYIGKDPNPIFIYKKIQKTKSKLSKVHI